MESVLEINIILTINLHLQRNYKHYSVYELCKREWEAGIKRKYVHYFVPKFVAYETTDFRNTLYIWIFFLICIVWDGVQTGSTQHVGHLLAYCTCSGWLWGWRIWWNEWKGKPKYSEKTCPGATLPTTNPTWPAPGLNPGRRGGKPATNRFSYGAALHLAYLTTFS
jgi:hypothetical protein